MHEDPAVLLGQGGGSRGNEQQGLCLSTAVPFPPKVPPLPKQEKITVKDTQTDRHTGGQIDRQMDGWIYFTI